MPPRSGGHAPGAAALTPARLPGGAVLSRTTSSFARSIRLVAGSAAGQVEQHLGGDRRHVAQRLAHGGQGGLDPAGDGHVVVADHRQVPGDVEAEPPGRAQDAERLQVRPGEDRGRPVGARQQVHRVLISGVDVEVAIPDEVGVDGEPRLVVGDPEAGDPGPAAHHVLRAGDDRDAAVAQLQQMTGGEQAAVPVVRADHGHGLGDLTVGVDDDERDLRPPQLPLLRLGRPGHDEQHAERPMVEHAVQPLIRWQVRPVELGQDDLDPRGGGDGVDALDDLHRPHGVQLVEDEVDLPLERAPLRTAAVLVPREAGLDAFPGVGRDVGPAVEDLGDRGHRDAELFGDGRDRGRAWIAGGGGAGHLSARRLSESFAKLYHRKALGYTEIQAALGVVWAESRGLTALLTHPCPGPIFPQY